MSTLTSEQQEAIRKFLEGKHIPVGLGHEHEACSIAAINLALFGKLTDEIPDCMSAVIGNWIIPVQDAMPDEMRNSKEWRELLPLAAGTGREYEHERLSIVMDWMWTGVLPQLQPLAEKLGFGVEWKSMKKEKTVTTTLAYKAAKARTYIWQATETTETIMEAVSASSTEKARAAFAVAKASYWSARWIAAQARAYDAVMEQIKHFWTNVDPVAILRKLTSSPA